MTGHESSTKSPRSQRRAAYARTSLPMLRPWRPPTSNYPRPAGVSRLNEVLAQYLTLRRIDLYIFGRRSFQIQWFMYRADSNWRLNWALVDDELQETKSGLQDTGTQQKNGELHRSRSNKRSVS